MATQAWNDYNNELANYYVRRYKKIILIIMICTMFSFTAYKVAIKHLTCTEYSIEDLRYYEKADASYFMFFSDSKIQEYFEVFYNNTKVEVATYEIILSDRSYVEDLYIEGARVKTFVYMTKDDYLGAIRNADR